MDEIKIKLDCSKNMFKLMVLGDLHIGDALCDLELIKDTIDYVKKNKDCYVIKTLNIPEHNKKTSQKTRFLFSCLPITSLYIFSFETD